LQKKNGSAIFYAQLILKFRDNRPGSPGFAEDAFLNVVKAAAAV
jgi:hypothetical protein